jgi:anti-sigma B factor antagonist
MEFRIEGADRWHNASDPGGPLGHQGGAAQIDLRLSAVTGAGRPIILDLAEVTYLSSMGIRSIVMGAKACQLRGGKLVLLAPADDVQEVLTIAGINMLVPIYHDIEAAILAVTS